MPDYDRIARAIAYIQAQVPQQPSLEDIAAQVHLSPYHFQRLFTRWAGTTPKRFLQVLTLELGKQLLREPLPLLAVTQSLGLSSSSRLHDHFVQIEAMTPGEYRSNGAGMQLRYGSTDTPFGELFVAQTARGICRAVFVDSANELQHEILQITTSWPAANILVDNGVAAEVAAVLAALPHNAPIKPLTLHLHGTNFQLAVWRALLRIPTARACSYGELATQLNMPKAARAVGTAIGANPVAVLIPCHRVIQQSGALGGYRWGLPRKVALQAWEVLKEQSGT